MARKYVDFEVIKESWNKYGLQDGTKFKVRAMLKSVWTDQADGKAKHNAEIDTHQVTLCDPAVQGKPDPRIYTQEQLEENIEVKH